MTTRTPLTPTRRRSPSILQHPDIQINRLPIRLESDDAKVITLPFLITPPDRICSIFERVAGLTERQVKSTLDAVKSSYANRHRDILATFREHYDHAVSLTEPNENWSENRQLLAGSYFTMEYAVESAALFNPSIVPHPDQGGLGAGELRIILSLRATGEGHISSAVFRTGIIRSDHSIELDPPSRIMSRSRLSPDYLYHRPILARKLREMSVHSSALDALLTTLPERFTMDQLNHAARSIRDTHGHLPDTHPTLDALTWLVRSNYHITLPADADLSQLVIYPLSNHESRGIEDLRMVRFNGDDHTTTYFGTYTAFDGHRIMPVLIETTDFRNIEIHSLNGNCARNKGMALFPRCIRGHYVMCSRIDGVNLFISYSNYVHFWESADIIHAAKAPWELTQIGNCGSPIETPEGWLLITHGVGPMRTYCIGAMLLDLENPTKVIGQLRQPLLAPSPDEREGYVPNVVYSCGSLVHKDTLILPYALADKATRIATVNLNQLLGQLKKSPRKT